MKASFLAFVFSVLHFILYKKPVFWRLQVKVNEWLDNFQFSWLRKLPRQVRPWLN